MIRIEKTVQQGCRIKVEYTKIICIADTSNEQYENKMFHLQYQQKY